MSAAFSKRSQNKKKKKKNATVQGSLMFLKLLGKYQEGENPSEES